jgi:hypothetical protein
MSTQVIDLLRTRRVELLNIAPERGKWSEITEWHTRARLLISQYFKEQVKAFDKLIEVKWVAFPRMIAMGGKRVDNSKTDNAERSANNRVVQNAHKRLVAFLDGLMEICGLIPEEYEQQMPESSAIFAEIDVVLQSSLMPQQYRTLSQRTSLRRKARMLRERTSLVSSCLAQRWRASCLGTYSVRTSFPCLRLWQIRLSPSAE